MAEYGKRPLWQWVVIYLVIGAIVYGAVYYFWMKPKGGYSGSGGNYNYTAPSSPSQGSSGY